MSYRADFVKVAEQVLRFGEHELTFDLYLFERLHEALNTPRNSHISALSNTNMTAFGSLALNGYYYHYYS